MHFNPGLVLMREHAISIPLENVAFYPPACRVVTGPERVCYGTPVALCHRPIEFALCACSRMGSTSPVNPKNVQIIIKRVFLKFGGFFG